MVEITLALSNTIGELSRVGFRQGEKQKKLPRGFARFSKRRKQPSPGSPSSARVSTESSTFQQPRHVFAFKQHQLHMARNRSRSHVTVGQPR